MGIIHRRGGIIGPGRLNDRRTSRGASATEHACESFVAVAVFVTLLLWAIPASAACTGSSPNLTAPTWNDVAACHSAARDGDKITVTPGSYTVTGQTSITKFVTLVGTGVTLSYNFSTDHMLAITESTVGSTSVQGFTVVRGASAPPAGSALGMIGVFPHATPNDDGQPVLITGNTFKQDATGDTLHFFTNRGVVWNNTASGTPWGPNCFNTASFIRQKNGALFTSWTTPATYGNADTTGTGAVYAENNTLINVMEGAFDCDDNCRIVIRYNTLTNSTITTHGDTSTPGGRYVEVYNNTFIRDESPVPSCSSNLPANLGAPWIVLRAGTMLVHDNVLPRNVTAAWGDKGSMGAVVFLLRRQVSPYPCWGTLTPGSYPAPYQPGWGYITGGTRAGETNVFMDSEPMYIWNNTGTGATIFYVGDYDCGGYLACPNCAACPTAANFIQQGRDYFIGTAKPGYAPYTYPHPLTGLASSVSAPAPTPSSPPPPSAPPAPSGLTVK